MSRDSLKAVILVGGPGTRLQPLTNSIPKSMVPVLNRPFLEHTIAYLKRYGVDSIILALNYLPAVIQDYFGDGSKFGVEITYCVEGNPLGTAGAVKNAEKYLQSTFIVLNGDVFTDLDIADMIDFHRYNKAKVTISLKSVDNPSAFGLVETEDTYRVKRFIEKPDPDQITTNWINAGTYILEPEVLEHVPPDNHYMFERGLFPLLIKLGEPVYGYPFHGYWLDMGTPEKYLGLNCDLLLSKTSSLLTASLTDDEVRCDRSATVHPSVKIIGPVVIGDNCRIDQRVHIKGPVVIGQDCHVTEGASIERATLWGNVHIGTNSILKQCIIGSNSNVENNSQITNCVFTPDSQIPLIFQQFEVTGLSDMG
ncbi:sugar phosphate nucleotidyltransferase [Chloroflexota bacterium]